MEISSVNFTHLFRPNQEQLRKMQLQALWQESSLRNQTYACNGTYRREFALREFENWPLY
jgi:hypothetical protein